MALTHNANSGLLICGSPSLSIDDLETASHPYKLPPRDQIFLHLDDRQMGVGGDNSWGAMLHREFRIKPESMSYRFRLRPYNPATENPADLARFKAW